MRQSNSIMQNINNLLLLALVIILLLVGFSIQNYGHSQTLVYDYLTQKAVTFSLLYESSARQNILDAFPAPPENIINTEEINSIVVFNRDQSPVYMFGKNIFDAQVIRKVIDSQQINTSKKTINGRAFLLVAMPFHLGDLQQDYGHSATQHLPRFKVLAVAIPISVGNEIILPSKIQLLLSLSLLIFFIVISYWQWKNIRSYILMQKSLVEKENLASIGLASARLAHEIRNPLAGIKGLAQLLQEENLSEQPHAYLTSIVTQTDRLNDIISELLDFSKPKLPICSYTPLLPLIEELCSCYANVIQEKNLTVKHYFNENYFLFADRELLIRVLHNLMANALHAINHNGEINFYAEKTFKTFTLKICNTGDYIAEGYLDKIFSPFFSTKTKGSGLGLSICKQIMTAHLGQIDVNNTNQTVCFTLSFPKEENHVD